MDYADYGSGAPYMLKMARGHIARKDYLLAINAINTARYMIDTLREHGDAGDAIQALISDVIAIERRLRTKLLDESVAKLDRLSRQLRKQLKEHDSPYPNSERYWRWWRRFLRKLLEVIARGAS